MTNPRKFSEKIALHTQKQAEETAAFEEIMREVIGATRKSNATSYGNQQQQQQQQQQQLAQQQQQQHLSTPVFNVARAGSLPNVAQMAATPPGTLPQHNLNQQQQQQPLSPSVASEKSIDLQGALTNLQEIKNGCLLERSSSARSDTSPMARRNHYGGGNAANNGAMAHHNHHHHHHHQRRSPSPYSTNNTAYLSPPPPDNHWRRTNSDSALHQITSPVDHFVQFDPQQQQQQQIFQQQQQQQQQQRRGSPAMMIEGANNNNGGNNMTLLGSPGAANGILLSASLPDHQLRPRSCEVPDINIQTDVDRLYVNMQGTPGDTTTGAENNGHAHIMSISNTGSLPDLTSLHFPVPLHTPIDSDGSGGGGGGGGANGQIVDGARYAELSNGNMLPTSPDSPFSPTSSVNSNLSPPPPCNLVNNNNNGNSGNYNNQSQSQSPRSRQASPGPCSSPQQQHSPTVGYSVLSPRHVNTMVLPTTTTNNNNNASNQQVSYNSNARSPAPCYKTPPSPAVSPRPSLSSSHNNNNTQPGPNGPAPHSAPATAQHSPLAPRRQMMSGTHMSDASPRSLLPTRSYSFKEPPPRITVEGLVMDSGGGNANGGQPQQYKSLNSPTAAYGSPVGAGPQAGTTFNQQFQFNSTPSLQNFNSISMHRSTTPTDSCSAPTSPASQSLSPANSPEMPTNINGGGGGGAGQNGDNAGGYSPNYANYLNQANVVQHQLEQFRMTNDGDANYMLTEDIQNTNAFYLNNANMITMSQYTGDNTAATMQQQQQQQQQQDSSANTSPSGVQFFTNDSSQLYYDSSGMIDANGMIYMKTGTGLIGTQAAVSVNGNTVYTTCTSSQQQLVANSSHCTTPQTPTSIPDIILTEPNTLDDIQTDFAKDLNNTIVNLNNMGSFDSDIFGPNSEDTLRGVGSSFDSFDLDGLNILTESFGDTSSVTSTTPTPTTASNEQ